MDDGQLPNCEQAYIADAKLYRYLLNHEHPDGKSKARFFDLIGYTPDKSEQLRADLLRLACMGIAVDATANQPVDLAQGRKYTVIGPINAPNGKTYQILSVWVLELPAFVPRLITAYPTNQ